MCWTAAPGSGSLNEHLLGSNRADEREFARRRVGAVITELHPGPNTLPPHERTSPRRMPVFAVTHEAAW